MTKAPDSAKKQYLANEADYRDCIRVSAVDAIDCWYGFIYTKNASPFRLRETVTPQLEGLEIAWPEGKASGDNVEIDIDSGEDHIIVLRRVEGRCRYGLGYKVHPRELSNVELVQKAMEMDNKNHFGNYQAYFKLYNTAQNAVFYFENPDATETLEAEFKLELKNLSLIGDEAGETTFKVTLGPGDTGYKILKAVSSGEGTGIRMGYSFSAK